MLSYPSIPSWKASLLGEPCIGFYKYDGSNLRWEYSPKRGWYKYGTRNHLFDKSSTPYNQAIPFFQDVMGQDIVDITCAHFGYKPERIVAFTEFYGPSSFAGAHVEEEQKDLVLFDVSVYKRGFIDARTFVKLFSHLPYTAKVVYEGNMSKQFCLDVYEGKYPVVEGIVCKGDDWKAKVKTKAYLDKLKGKFGTDWEKYE